jgi:uncharacterized spore protein YtfJ
MPTKKSSPEYNQVLDKVQQNMDRFLNSAHVDAVYGAPIAHEETIIIPTAEVLSFTGFGVGGVSGNGPVNPADPEGVVPEGEGFGGGGGGRVFSRPVAVIIAAPEGVRVEPVVDVTKIGLAALTAAGFMFGMWMRMARPRG